jgi:hypothetical protein
MGREEYRDARKRIDAGYQAERQKCGERHGNSADLCIARAHGTRDVAKAELRAAFKPGPGTNYDAAVAVRRLRMRSRKQECDDRKPEARKELREGSQGGAGARPRRREGAARYSLIKLCDVQIMDIAGEMM